MKYKTVTVKEDKDILKDVNQRQLALMVGCDPSYISHLISGRRIAKEDFYKKIKVAKDKLTKQ